MPDDPEKDGLASAVALSQHERAVQSARLFRSLATPTCLRSSSVALGKGKRPASELLREAAALGAMDSFEGMDEWFKTEPVKKAAKSTASSPANGPAAVRTGERGKGEGISNTRSEDLLKTIGLVKKMILNREKIEATLTPFVPSSAPAEDKPSPASAPAKRTESDVPSIALFLGDLQSTDLSDRQAWKKLLDRIVRLKGHPLVIAWIAEHLVFLSMTAEQHALRQIARLHWQASHLQKGGTVFNPSYASREELFAHLLQSVCQ